MLPLGSRGGKRCLLAAVILTAIHLPAANGFGLRLGPPRHHTQTVHASKSTPTDVRPDNEGPQRTLIVSERAWNSSTMGALPSDIYSLTKEMSDCALMAVVNGELGLTLNVGGEFDCENRYYDHTLLTGLIVELASKMCVLGQTRVLFAGAQELEHTMRDIATLTALEAKREQEEMGVVAKVRRQMQARFPDVRVPEMPTEMRAEKEGRMRERQRLATNVRWGDLLGGYRLSGDPMTDVEEAPQAALKALDLSKDRMYIIVSPTADPVEMVTVRRIIKAAKNRPVVLINHRLHPPPLELAIFQPAYHLDIWRLKRRGAAKAAEEAKAKPPSDPYYDFPMPSIHGQDDGVRRVNSKPPQNLDEVETVLIRKFPLPWQVFGNFEGSFEVVGTYMDKPSPEEIRERVWQVADEKLRARGGSFPS